MKFKGKCIIIIYTGAYKHQCGKPFTQPHSYIIISYYFPYCLQIKSNKNSKNG